MSLIEEAKELFGEMRDATPEEKVFETINGVPNGKVIAWRPLPEPYSPERSDNHDGE